MTGSTYQFGTTWRVAAPHGRVFATLAGVEAYAQWWPQVRRVRRIDGESAAADIRSFLPYTLRLVLRREVEDEGAGVLRVRVEGDLHGWSAWALCPGASGGTVARYTQEVDVHAPLLRRLSSLGRPLLVANHGFMLRSGERGLRRHLAR